MQLNVRATRVEKERIVGTSQGQKKMMLAALIVHEDKTSKMRGNSRKFFFIKTGNL
jgi:hypothetical protein